MQMLNPLKYDTYKPFSWTHEYLHQLLTTGKHKIVNNKHLDAAFQLVDRADFVPQEFKDIAYMDYDIDIGFGCTLDKPTVIAEVLELLEPKEKCSVLDIGTGSGYVATLLAVACGEKSKIISIERIQFLSDIARMNIAKYPDLKNLNVYLRDGTLGLADQAPFDIIHISAAYDEVPEIIKNQLKIGGRLVAPTTDGKLHFVKRPTLDEFQETIKSIPKFDKIKQGIE